MFTWMDELRSVEAVVVPDPDVYGLAWKLLEQRINKTRRQSISKKDLAEWQLKALEQAVDILVCHRSGDGK
ncbi:hypothetical protein LCGC14_1327650 [marine sediment metagenome]|uniref:Uncharacterized protein n=1 Tax=marine sediment metagenome TaxID=412755 RepID=A0A0F9L3G4_9ZZZZ